MTKKAGSALTLERFLPYRLSILSNKVSADIARSYHDKFGLSIIEWRIMAVLGEYPGISADEVSTKTQIEKSILSRAINVLRQRNLLNRKFHLTDRRRSILTLTATGIQVYKEIVPMAYQYEQRLLTCFSKHEKLQFSELIDKLYEHAEDLDV